MQLKEISYPDVVDTRWYSNCSAAFGVQKNNEQRVKAIKVFWLSTVYEVAVGQYKLMMLSEKRLLWKNKDSFSVQSSTKVECWSGNFQSLTDEFNHTKKAVSGFARNNFPHLWFLQAETK